METFSRLYSSKGIQMLRRSAVIIALTILSHLAFEERQARADESTVESTRESKQIITLLQLPNDNSPGAGYMAIFGEAKNGTFTWDVPVTHRGPDDLVMISGMVEVDIEWQFPDEKQESYEQLLAEKSLQLYDLMKVEAQWLERTIRRSRARGYGKLRVFSVSRLRTNGRRPECCLRTLQIDSIRALSDDALIKAYETAGLDLIDTGYGPADEFYPPSTIPVGTTPAKLRGLKMIRQEIVKRGDRMVPLLIEFLRKESKLRRPGYTPPDRRFILGEQGTSKARSAKRLGIDDISFVRDTVSLLVVIGDPAPANLMLQIAEENPNTWRGRAALDGLQRLTFCSLQHHTPEGSRGHLMVEHPLARELQYDKQRIPKQIAFFREWLSNEGKDPDNWLPLARARARQQMESENLADVYCAAQFFQPRHHLANFEGLIQGTCHSPPHDDDPSRTITQLTKVMRSGKKLPFGRDRWSWLLSGFCTTARPHLNLVTGWARDTQLHQIGGNKLLGQYIEQLPEPNDSTGVALRRFTIDRWAGRSFGSDEDRKNWWKEFQSKSDEERLRAGLPFLAKQVDLNDLNALKIARSILPDAPLDIRHSSLGPFSCDSGTQRESLEQWIHEHNHQLEYKPVVGLFRVAYKNK